MRRLVDLENTLRNAELLSVVFKYERYTKNIKQESSVEISLVKFEKQVINLRLTGVQKVDLCDDYMCSSISHVKAIEDGNTISISLDPYKEDIDYIDERDNFIFSFTEYQLVEEGL
ncbi:hypothetical protein [Photobacterium alginatilyticum]|uniref:Phage protein n=1 Tax=Photobacterium alginatilyticum TaxID=1775171 RepID=A0ABW9YUB1_9GAMM|nr:hypothetical protein [Photobacterium alginatilyticum]NBI56316.1 hypothetical protein [Photobacterium alginatilyticum]